MRVQTGAGTPCRLRALGLVALSAALPACRTHDPMVLDERLRAVTLDAYVAVIERQYGGLARTGVTGDELRARFGPPARAATEPDAFYRVLRGMLRELDDPHASLTESPRFWNGPLAEPERAQVVCSGGALWLSLPEASLRTRAELEAELARWLEGIREGVEAGAATASATLLVRSASASAGRGGTATRWLELAEVDGVPVEEPHGAGLLLKGRLGSVVEVSGVLEGREVTLALLRNAGSFAPEERGAPRELLGPGELAALLDPAVTPPRRRRWIGRSAARVRRGLGALLDRGEELPVEEEARREFGLEARRLWTAGGRSVGYLRLEDFHRGAWDGEGPPALAGAMAEVLGRLEPGEDLVIDLTGNPGGAWTEAGALLSFLLPAGTPFIPHEVRSVEERRTLGFVRRTTRSLRLQPLDVAPFQPGRVLVLVDQRTASAAEIVASALRGLVGAELVGERTAGAEFSTGRYLAPDGSTLTIGLAGGMVEPCEHFQGAGLVPDLEVPSVAPDRGQLDPTSWRLAFRLAALRAALVELDRPAEPEVQGP